MSMERLQKYMAECGIASRRKCEEMIANGEVKVNGEVWSAKSFDDSVIPVDSEVIIDHIEGVKVIVKPSFTNPEAPKK